MPANYIMPSRYKTDFMADLGDAAGRIFESMEEEKKRRLKEEQDLKASKNAETDRAFVESERRYELDKRTKLDASSAAIGALINKQKQERGSYNLRKDAIAGAKPEAERLFNTGYGDTAITKNQIPMPYGDTAITKNQIPMPYGRPREQSVDPTYGRPREQSVDPTFGKAREAAPIGMLEKDEANLREPDEEKNQKHMDELLANHNLLRGETKGIDPREFSSEREAAKAKEERSRQDKDNAYALDIRKQDETERGNKEDEKLRWFNAKKDREDKLTADASFKLDNEAYKRASSTAKTVEGSDVTRAASAVEDLDSILLKHTGAGLADAKTAEGVGALSDVPGRDTWESWRGNEAFTQTKQAVNKLANMIMRRETGASLTAIEAQGYLQSTLNKPGVKASAVLDAARNMANAVANDVLLLEGPVLNAKDEAGIKASEIYRGGFGGRSWSDRVGKFARREETPSKEDYLGDTKELKAEIAKRRGK